MSEDGDNDKPKRKLSLKGRGSAGGASSGLVSATGKPVGVLVVRNGKRVIQPRNERGAAVAPPTINRYAKKKPINPKAKKKPAKPVVKKVVVPSSEIKVRELNKVLVDAFPVWRDRLPLAIGAEKEVFKFFGESNTKGASKRVMQKLLNMHTKHPDYLAALARGGVRYHLGGEPDQSITPYQAELAGEWLAKKQSAK